MFREVKLYAPCHTDDKWQSHSSNPRLSDSKAQVPDMPTSTDILCAESQ